MDSNCELCPPDTITVAKNITINGNGARVTFCNPGTPQFIVEPGVIVTLENITLSRINNTTFNIGQNAMIQIGNNVFFELSDDVTFIGSAIPALSISNNPILRVLGDVNNPNAFTIRGIGGRKVLEFLPLFINTQTGMQVLSTFDIGLATVVLENVEFIGLESVNVTRETIPNFGVFAGAFALDTQTIINLQTDPSLYPQVKMNFLVEGENNTLRFLNDNVILTGFINFSSFLDSELHMAFDLGEKLITTPQITIGDNVIFLGSTDGRARLVFDDYSVQLNHLGSNSFVTDAHSFIGGRNITVLNFPIKQQSVDLIVDSSVNVTSPLPNAIDPSFIRLLRPTRRVNDCITALDVLRARNDAEGERLRAELLHKMGVKQIPAPYMSNHSKLSAMGSVADVVNHKPEQKPTQNVVIKPGKKQPVQKPKTNGPRRDIDLTDIADDEIVLNQTRSFTVPLIQLTNNATGIQLSNANGVISVFNGAIPAFGVDSTLQLDLYMLGNATLVQGDFPTTLKQNDTIYVTGLKNTIVVKDQLTIDGTFNFNAGSELIFEFDSTGPTRLVDKAVFFNIDLLELPERTTLTFKGRGTAWFKDGMVISCGPSVPESTSCGPVVQQPANVTIQITDAARMKLSGTGTPGIIGSSIVTIEGQALIIVDDGGKVDIQGNQQLIICDKKEDNINIIVSDSGLIVLDATNVGGDAKAKMSLHEGSYSLYITQDGSLEIGSGGVFEINTLNNGSPSGTLTLLDLSDGGNLILKTAGLLNIGRNNVNISTGSDNLIEFNPVRASIEGDGIVQLAGTQFAGRLFNHEFPAAFTATAQNLVRALINRVPSLSFSTVFTDASDNQVLFNKDIDLYRTDLYILSQTIIGLLPGDIITGDDPSTGLVYGTNGGVQFTIDRNGNRT